MLVRVGGVRESPNGAVEVHVTAHLEFVEELGHLSLRVHLDHEVHGPVDVRWGRGGVRARDLGAFGVLEGGPGGVQRAEADVLADGETQGLPGAKGEVEGEEDRVVVEADFTGECEGLPADLKEGGGGGRGALRTMEEWS